MRIRDYLEPYHGVLSNAKSLRLNVRFLLSLVLMGLLLPLFPSLPVSAESKQSSLTITTTSSSHNISIMPSPSGTFGKSNSSTIRVSTNNYSGYTLSISMPTTSGVSSGSLSDGLGHEITTLGSAVSESAFSGSSGTSYNNQWGYRPSQYVNSTSGSNTVVSNTSFLPAPSSTGTLIDVTSSANSTAKSYTLDVATRISSSLPSGSYAGRLIITAVANNIVYSLNYDKNTTSDVSNMPTPNPQVATIAGGTAASESVTTLSSTIPTRTGYNFSGWCSVTTTNDAVTGSQTCPGTTYPAGGSYGIDQTSDGSNIRLYAIWTSKTYTINLNGNGATTAGSSTTTATYSSPTLSTITNPSRVYNIGGYTLPSGNKADGATVTYPSSGNCTSSSNCKSTYTFNGWYKESATTNKIASNATTPVLQASTTYTDVSGKWTYTTTSPAVTLYAGWTSQAVTLPTITKTGHTCGWTTTSTGATSITYDSGGSLTPTGNVTLYGVCTTNSYTITLDRNGGSTGSTSTTVAYGATTLSAITVPTRANTTGTRTVSGLTADGTNASGATVTFSTSGTCTSTTNCKSTNTTTYTFNGWYKESGATNKIASNAATPVLQANTSYTNASGAWTSTSAQTLYAGWTSSAGAYSSITLPSITKTGYTCGWDTNASATNPTYASGASITPSGDLALHGICKANTYTITLNGNGATTPGSSTATATYDSTTLSTITNPSRSYTISGFDTSYNNASGATVSSSSTLTSTYTFNGWYKESGATNKIASNATAPALQASTSYTDANGKWTSTSAQTLYAGWTAQAKTLPTITKTGHTCGWTTSTSTSTITYASGGSITPSANTVLHGVCTTNSYTITLNANGGSGGSSSTTVSYGATTLGTITNPTRASTTGTRTISGFTMTTSGTNASVSYPSSGCTSATNCKSTNTTTYTFNGWYKETGATNKIATNATTPVLQASTSYTDANGKWTSTSAQTLYAGWTSSAGAYSSVTLPTITRTGSTCGWSTSSAATTWTYNSGASVTPTGDMTLYGVCRNNITLNNAGATTAGSTSATVTYNATSLSSITLPQRKYTVSGFTLTTSGTNATVSSTSTLTNTATFNGWYTASSGGAKIAGNTTTPALEASTTYTNASKQWTYTTAGAITLYSQWTDNSVTLPTITRTGSTCGWSTSSAATTITYASGSSLTPTANLTLYGVCVTNITLNKNGATNSPTTSTTVNYNATSLNSIATLPTRSYTISGFTLPSGNNASGATVSSTSTITSNYTFNGWYKESGATNKIAAGGSDTTPDLQPSTTYTNSSKQWTYTTAGAITLYAGWTAQSKTLPTITKAGHTCGWTTTSTGATTITYASGGSITPSGNTTLYGVCTINKYTLTINFAGTGVSSVQVRTASGTGGTLMGTVSTSGGTVSNLTYNTNYYLYPSFTTGYKLSSWTKTSGAGSISSTIASNPYYTIGAGNATVTITGKDECAGYICYNANGSNVVGTMGKQETVTDGASATLLASNFSRTGYGFAGWSDKADPATSGAKLYGPQETITVPTGTSQNGLRLYAIWIQSAGSLQTDAKTVCNTLTPAPTDGTANLASVSALTDQRDNNTYAIAKLADGNCWMVENLRLDSTAAHNSDGSLAQGYGTSATYGNFGGLANAESSNFTDSTTANSLYYSGTQSGTASINIGTTKYPAYRMPRYNNLNTSTRASNPTYNTGNMYSYGNYYTWHAAMANTTNYSNPTSTDADGKTSETVNTSLCPTGWRLPYGGDTSNGTTIGGFYNLNYKINNDSNVTDSTASLKLRSFPNNFLYSGYFNTSSASNRGVGGYYWSSTVAGNVDSYFLYLYSSGVSPGTFNDRNYRGQSIRCLLSTITSATYLQDVTKEMVDNTAEGTTTTLKDKRDEKSYTVGRLADGNVWLLDNLALDLSSISLDTLKGNTNASDTSLTYLKNGGGTADDKYATAAVTNSISVQYYSIPSYDISEANIIPSDSISTTGGYKVGGYYNYCAASAGSYCYGDGSSAGSPIGSPTEDICPIGWRMPTAGFTGEFGALFSNEKYNNYNSYRNALRLPLNGRILYTNNSIGSNGFFWTSSSSSIKYYSTALLLNQDGVPNPSYGDYRFYGEGVRCIFESRTISDVTYLQDVTPVIANNTPEGTTATLKDKRDEQSYTVGKLADGKLWLLDNLALDLTNSTVLNGMNESNTNASNTTLGYLKNGGGTASDQYAITGVVNWTDSPTYASDYSYSDPLVNLTNEDIIPSDATSQAGQYKVGGYYNYCAASAGSYCYGNGTSEGTSSGNATEDICPKGWRMPTGTTSGEYSALANAIYGSTGSTSDPTAYANYRSALRLPLSGYFYGGSAVNQGSFGYFWSSTRYNNDLIMYGLYIDTSNVLPSDIDYRVNGNPVRCVLDTTQPSNSPQSVSPNQSSTNSQPIATNSVSPDSTSVQPTRSAPLAISAPTQNATPATSQDDSNDSTDTTEETADSTSTTTSPQGVISEQNIKEHDGSDLYGPNQNPNPAINLIFAGVAAATAGTILFLLAKRKKDEDEEEDQPTE